MLKTLTSRQVMMATASVATIALAVVLTGQYNAPDYGTDEVFAVSEAKIDTRTRETAVTEGEVVAMETEEADLADAVVMSLAAPRMESVGIASAPMVAPSAVGRMIAIPNDAPVLYEQNTEKFPDADMNPLQVVSEDPVSTFSIDVDTASYAFVRSSILGGNLPPADAVRTEEMINYFAYDYPVPARVEVPFTTSVTIMDTPWNPDTKLLHIGIKGYELAVEDRPPVNLIFLIDTSGSMQDSDKLPLLVNSFRLMLANLQPDDKVAIVTYAGSAGTVLEPTAASDSTEILASLERLYAGGSTAGQAGLQQAYALAEQMADGNEATSRVILATDGDFNVGISDPESLKEYVEDKREGGVYLSVLGFGRGNYNDALMQTLAQNGNGTAAYIDTLAEAQKVLIDQIGGALFTIAQDVKIQVEFNPAEIAEYRLIGYETRALNREDFNNDAVDAGEIGAGHTVTAIYEITPVGSPAVMVDDLRYGTDEVGSLNTGEYAFLKLRYKNPGEDVSNLITTPITPDADAGLGGEAEFAAAVAGFGQILRGDDLMHGWEVSDAQALAQASKGEDRFGYRSELITLMRLAESLN
jgi:Ca-activated chloride channel family protein